jgi:hypothetical protein
VEWCDLSWKEFLFVHPWATKAVVTHYHPDIEDYDLNNYLRTHPDIKLRRDGFDPSKLEGEPLLRVFEMIWAFYLTENAGGEISSDSDEFVRYCLKHTTDNVKRSSVGHLLLNSNYFGVLPEAEDWKSKGYTYLAYFFLNLDPTAARLKSLGVFPEMFTQTRVRDTSITANVYFVKQLYLKFYVKLYHPLLRSDALAKEYYFHHWNDTGFFTSKHGRAYGWVAKMGPWVTLKEQLRDEFGRELGFIKSDAEVWRSSVFREQNPSLKLDKCMFCGRPHPELHHLLPQRDYPSYVYHPENIVPLCADSHSLITHMSARAEHLDAAYRSSIKNWLEAKAGEKAQCFHGVLADIHGLLD